MVTIVSYKSFENEEEEKFFALVVQGGLETVKSKETGQNYFTVRTAQVNCTFDENTCKSLIGSQIPGSIKKIEVEPYEYPDSQTGEIITYSHRNVFVSEAEDILEKNVVTEAAVI